MGGHPPGTYPKLKEYVEKINSPGFAVVITFLKTFPDQESLDRQMAFAFEAIEKIDEVIKDNRELFRSEAVREINQAEDEEQTEERIIKGMLTQDTVISSLLMIKRSQLEHVVSKITKYRTNHRKKSDRNLSSKIVSEIAKKDIPKSTFLQIEKSNRKKVLSSINVAASAQGVLSVKTQEEEVKLDEQNPIKTTKLAKITGRFTTFLEEFNNILIINFFIRQKENSERQKKKQIALGLESNSEDDTRTR